MYEHCFVVNTGTEQEVLREKKNRTQKKVNSFKDYSAHNPFDDLGVKWFYPNQVDFELIK